MPTSFLARIVRFSTFELNLQTGELRQRGQKVKLQEQSFQVLAALLERPGELVTREELRSKLWPAETFVDFDHSLNAAIKRLRDALGESAERPIFVETLARRGYRFIGNVEILTPAAQSDLNGLRGDRETVPTKLPPTSTSGPWARKWQFGLAVLASIVVASMAAGWFYWRQVSSTKTAQPPARLQPLTSNATENAISASAISPDGKYFAYSDKTGTYLRSLSTDEVHALLPKGPDVTSLEWFPDSSELLASWAPPQGNRIGLWTLSILGGAPRQVSDEGWSPSVSRDGSQIVFLKTAAYGETGHEVWLMRANGADQRKLFSFPEAAFASPVWSPDGRWIAYFRFGQGAFANQNSLEIFNVEKGITKVVFSDPHLDYGLKWLPDGRLMYAFDGWPNQNNSNFFAAGIDFGTGRFKGKSSRITDGDGFVEQPSITTDGTHLVFNRTKSQLDVYVSEFFAKGPRISTPRRLTLDDADDFPFDWTPDNKSVLFGSGRTGKSNMFRQRIDETSAEMLALGPEQNMGGRVSPDGSQILYLVFKDLSDLSQPKKLMRAPLNGGPPQVLIETPWINAEECSLAPAAVCAFSREEPQEFVLSIFDPANGKVSHEVKRPQVPGGWNWGLSPDGTSFVLVAFGPSDNRIQLVPISGQPAREITVKNWSGFTSVDWAADSKGLFVTSNPTGWSSSILYVDLAGNAHELWRVKSPMQIWTRPSHNGKYVAILAPTIGSNVWMADNF